MDDVDEGGEEDNSGEQIIEIPIPHYERELAMIKLAIEDHDADNMFENG